MSTGNIYTCHIIRREEGAIEAGIALDGNHPVYKGHFPELPLTPGVCQVDMIGEILGSELEKTLILSSASNIKFPAMLQPGNFGKLTMRITHSLEKGKWNVRASLQDGQRTYLKFKGEYVQHV